MCVRSFVLMSFFFLVIVFSVLLRFTSDYLLDIFNFSYIFDEDCCIGIEI